MFLDQNERFSNVSATQNRKTRRTIQAGGAVGLVAASMSSAYAALDVGVTTAISGAGTDASTMGAAVLVVLVGIAAFKYLRKAL